MAAIKDNIKRLRENADMSQEELGLKIGKTRSAISQYESGKIVPRMGVIEDIASLFGVQKSDIIGESPLSIPGSFYPAPSHYATAPLLGRIHAGDAQEPDILEKEIELPLSVSKSHPNAYFLEVEGDCMDKVYPEGCLILVDPDREPRNGSIAAVSVDGLGLRDAPSSAHGKHHDPGPRKLQHRARGHSHNRIERQNGKPSRNSGVVPTGKGNGISEQRPTTERIDTWVSKRASPKLPTR